MNKEIRQDIVYDVLVIGFGVAAISAAIYASRKGLKTSIIGTKVGGQVLDTLSIENIIGTKEIKGFEFAKNVEQHLNEYEVYVKKSNVKKIIDGKIKQVITTDGNTYEAKTIIIATGAKFKKMNIAGEDEFTGRGVHFCSTCDGPFYKGLDVVVVGGGNSGVEAALEFSKIAKSTTLIEYADKLKADNILQEKLKEENIPVLLNAKTEKIYGSDFVNKIEYKDMKTNETKEILTDGVFVEIGLSANTDFVSDLVKLNERKEIVIDKNNMTSVNGIFAAGDCTDKQHKQIVIAIGEGASAALSCFTYLLKEQE